MIESNITKPCSSYHAPPPMPELELAQPLLSFMSDTILSVITPIALYWISSLVFHYLDTHDYLNKYRLHTPEEVLKRNHVSRSEVIREVIIQQVLQTVVGLILGWTEPPEYAGREAWDIWNLSQNVGWAWKSLILLTGLDRSWVEAHAINFLTTYCGSHGQAIAGMDLRWKVAEALYWAVFPFMRLCLAIFVLDTWQYFWHRLMHQVPFLYRNFHSRHHRLYVPYAFGALYNHPIEGLILDTIGAGLAFKVSGMSMKGGIFFFGLSTMKTVDDHCGYKLPFDPFQIFFYNNAEYHDIHHQGWGIKNNFSQPFLICWDRWLNTQYTGSDVAERNRRTRERVHKQVALEKLDKKAVAIDKSGKSAAPTDEFAARRAVPEEDDEGYQALMKSLPKVTDAQQQQSSKADDAKVRLRPRTKKPSVVSGDVSVKDVTDGLKETEKWVHGVVGNVTGAKVR